MRHTKTLIVLFVTFVILYAVTSRAAESFSNCSKDAINNAYMDYVFRRPSEMNQLERTVAQPTAVNERSERTQ